MLQKILQLESKFHLGNATLIIAVLTFMSKITGAVRNTLLANQLGTGVESDIYLTAFRIPDLVYNLLIIGTLSVAFIPVFSSYYLTDKDRASAIANTVLHIAVIGMAIICTGIFIFAKPLTSLIAPGFDDDQIARTAMLTQLMIASPLIFTISNVFGSVLIGFKKFLIVNTAPLLYNIGIIIGIVFLYPQYGLRGIAGGVILGALMHVGVQIAEAYRHGFRWKPTLNIHDKGVKRVGKLFLPRIFGLDISYANLVIVSIVGSTLAAGSITAYNYANDLQAVSIGIFALSTAVAIFPVLSEMYAKDDILGFIKELQRAIIRILYFIIPITIVMLLFRAHIVRLLLGYGKCDWICTITTFNTLGVLSLGLLAQSLIPLFARSFYARHNTKTPVIIGLFTLCLSAILSYYLSFAFGVAGIALGFVIATTANCILMFGALHKTLTKEVTDESVMQAFDANMVRVTFKIIFASILMGAVCYITLYLV
ncbi:MAG: murein biosynthesis integral membrane protein MurJ, partial [bacterium]|nr:murein biosynthesis integral membrane protein MurJ [bacterium]